MTKTDTKTVIVLAALKEAELLGWDKVTLADIAAAAGMNLAELHDHIEDKFDILAALGRMIDRKVLEGLSPANPEESGRDRLFDILMERFDALNEHRAGIVSILKSFTLDPKQAIISFPHLCRSMCWMLESAGMSTYGVKGALKVAGLSAIYLNVLRIWMKDDSADLAKTMAALDKDLGRAERWSGSLGL